MGKWKLFLIFLSTLYTSYMILTCGNAFCCISKDSWLINYTWGSLKRLPYISCIVCKSRVYSVLPKAGKKKITINKLVLELRSDSRPLRLNGEKIESLPRPGIDKRKRSMKRDEFDCSHSLRASSPIWVSEVGLPSRLRRSLARFASLAQIGELARRLLQPFKTWHRNIYC